MSEAVGVPDPDFQALVRKQYAGNPHAMTELGARLLVGRDAPQAPADGAALIAEAAQQGDGAAWLYVAVIAAAGVGRAQSWFDAFDAVHRAADSASAQRQLELIRGMGIAGAGDVRGWLARAGARTLREAPRFVAFSGFLTLDVCLYLRERAKPKLVPAQVNDAKGSGLKLDPMRTNTGSVFSLIETDLVMQLVRARIAHAANVATEALEPPEVLHYSVGQTYRQHVDFFHASLPNFADEMRVKGQHVKTCLVYLNDDFEGGETDFPRIGMKFQEQTGEALIFDNVAANGIGDMNTVHTGLPPTRGEKWLFSQWIRNKPQRVA